MKKPRTKIETTFDDLWTDSMPSSNDVSELGDFEFKLIRTIIFLRNEKKMTQKELADAAGLKQSAVARLESFRAVPHLNTVLKILKPLGYTLKILPELQ